MWNESNDENIYEGSCLAGIEYVDDGDEDEENLLLSYSPSLGFYVF